MTDEINKINSAQYTGYFNKNIKKYNESGKKINDEKEKSLFEKMLKEEKIDVPKIYNSQKSKDVLENKEKKIDIKI